MLKCLWAQQKRDWISRLRCRIRLGLGVTILQSYLPLISEADFIHSNAFLIVIKKVCELKGGLVFCFFFLCNFFTATFLSLFLLSHSCWVTQAMYLHTNSQLFGWVVECLVGWISNCWGNIVGMALLLCLYNRIRTFRVRLLSLVLLVVGASESISNAIKTLSFSIWMAGVGIEPPPLFWCNRLTTTLMGQQCFVFFPPCISRPLSLGNWAIN